MDEISGSPGWDHDRKRCGILKCNLLTLVPCPYMRSALCLPLLCIHLLLLVTSIHVPVPSIYPTRCSISNNSRHASVRAQILRPETVREMFTNHTRRPNPPPPKAGARRDSVFLRLLWYSLMARRAGPGQVSYLLCKQQTPHREKSASSRFSSPPTLRLARYFSTGQIDGSASLLKRLDLNVLEAPTTIAKRVEWKFAFWERKKQGCERTRGNVFL
jgi:hypothetical protein